MFKKMILLPIICLLIPVSLVAQSKYYEKNISWEFVQQGDLILPTSDTTYLVGGNFANQDDLIFKSFALEINQYADTLWLQTYKQDIFYDQLVLLDMVSTSFGYALTGWFKETSSDLTARGFFLSIDHQGNQIALKTVKNDSLRTTLAAIALRDDGGYIVGGGVIFDDLPGNPRKLWLVGLDETGEKEWEKIIDEFNWSNRIHGLIPAPDGTFYIGATVNANTGVFGDILLMQVDATGTILQQKVYDLGMDDQGLFGIVTQDGGLFVGGKINHYSQGSVFKVDSELNIEWVRQNIFPDCGVGRGFVELEEGSFVVCGCRETVASAPFNEMSIIKLAPNGDTLWERIYGGLYNDYGYDMTTTPDGGFIISGRTETPGHADVYIVKTNCMGLLTEPQAAFDYTTTELTAQFINTSQYVYPDSIDGGHYVWDFGDGAVSSDVSPSHTYQAEGYYTVTLTAVVCSDTSVYEQEIAVGAVGVGHPLQTCASGCVQPFYPNPATQTATMSYDFKNEAQALLQIFDVAGRLVHQHFLEKKGVYNLALEGWTKGIYFYEVRSAKNIFLQEKLVVW